MVLYKASDEECNVSRDIQEEELPPAEAEQKPEGLLSWGSHHS